MKQSPESMAEHLSHYPELAEQAKEWRYGFASNALGGKVILITGAGDGLGAATAKTYASRCDCDPVKKLARKLQTTGSATIRQRSRSSCPAIWRL